MAILLDKVCVLYRSEVLPDFTGDPDFRALQSDVEDELLFRVGSGITGIAIDVLFFNGSTPIAGTCDAYVFKKATVLGEAPRPFIIGKSVGVTDLGPITAREKVQERDSYGVRLSNISADGATSLQVYIEGLAPEGGS